MSILDHPEPVEPTMTSTPDGLYCIVHGTIDCAEPWCWRCGNHLMDDFGRCADPRCRATNSPEARKVIERVKAQFGQPAPLEAIEYALGRFFLVGDGGSVESGAGAGEHAPDSSLPQKPMAPELPAIDSTRRFP